MPADIVNLKPGQQRYTQLLNDAGGIIDDLMVYALEQRVEHSLYLVVNASRKEVDRRALPSGCTRCILTQLPAAALLALQGPAAARVMERVLPRGCRDDVHGIPRGQGRSAGLR